MNTSKHILLFEDFVDVSEDIIIAEGLIDIVEYIKNLIDKKNKIKEKAMIINNKIKESGMKANNFKAKSQKAQDKLSQKIYSNRSTEEMMKQQIYTEKLKVLQMQTKLLDVQIKTSEMRKEKAAAAEKAQA